MNPIPLLPRLLLFSIATARWLIAPLVWGYAQPELLHRHGIDVTVDDFAQFEHLSLEDECQAYHDTWGIGANGEELYRELSDILIDGYSGAAARGAPGIFGAGEGGGHCHVRGYVHAGRAGAVCPRRCWSRSLYGICYHDGRGGTPKQFPDVYELALRRLEEHHGHKFERAHGCLRTPSLA